MPNSGVILQSASDRLHLPQKSKRHGKAVSKLEMCIIMKQPMRLGL